MRATTRVRRGPNRLLATCGALALVLAACGGQDEDPSGVPEETEDGAASADETDATDTSEESAGDSEESAGDEAADPLAPLAEEVTVTVGVLRVVNLAPSWLLEQTAAEYNVNVEFVEFGRFADARTALAAEEVDFTLFGPQDIALAMAGGSDNLVGLAGAGTGNDALAVSPDADIESWDDLAGKSIGIGAGSISWVKFAASIAEQGVDYGDLDIVNIAGGGTAYIQALERGDIDLAVLWEPFGAQAIEQGVGEYPPFDHNESDVVGGTFATFASTAGMVEQRPEVVQAMTNAYVDAVEMMVDDRDLWVETATDFAGLEAETVEMAIERSELGYEMDLVSIVSIAEFLLENGVVDGVDLDELAAAHDYSFLEARTGQSAEALGGGAG